MFRQRNYIGRFGPSLRGLVAILADALAVTGYRPIQAFFLVHGAWMLGL